MAPAAALAALLLLLLLAAATTPALAGGGAATVRVAPLTAAQRARMAATQASLGRAVASIRSSVAALRAVRAADHARAAAAASSATAGRRALRGDGGGGGGGGGGGASAPPRAMAYRAVTLAADLVSVVYTSLGVVKAALVLLGLTLANSGGGGVLTLDATALLLFAGAWAELLGDVSGMLARVTRTASDAAQPLTRSAADAAPLPAPPAAAALPAPSESRARGALSLPAAMIRRAPPRPGRRQQQCRGGSAGAGRPPPARVLRLPARHRAATGAAARAGDQQLLSWATGRDGDLQAEPLAVAVQECDHGRTLVALRDVQPGEVLLAVPMEHVFVSQPTDELEMHWAAEMALRLLREHHAAGAGGSAWEPWLASLPRDVPTPVEFTQREVELLAVPASIRAVVNMRQVLEDCYDALAGELAAIGCGWRDFLWAVQVLHSRCFFEPTSRRHLAVPGIDMCNHDSAAPCAAVRLLHSPGACQGLAALEEVAPAAAGAAGGSFFQLVAGGDGVRRGAQVSICYGSWPAEPFVLLFGFVPCGNPHDSVILFADLAAMAERYLAAAAAKLAGGGGGAAAALLASPGFARALRARAAEADAAAEAGADSDAPPGPPGFRDLTLPLGEVLHHALHALAGELDAAAAAAAGGAGGAADGDADALYTARPEHAALAAAYTGSKAALARRLAEAHPIRIGGVFVSARSAGAAASMEQFVEGKNPYAILGLEDPKCGIDDIKKAYRRLALIKHPDKAKTPNAAQEFDELKKAYAVLSDKAARGALDEFLDAQAAREQRLAKQDAKRQRLREELERKEREGVQSRSAEETARAKLKSELESLRARMAQEHQQRAAAAAEAAAARAASSAAAGPSSRAGGGGGSGGAATPGASDDDDTTQLLLRTVKASWDPTIGAYTSAALRSVFAAWPVEDVILKEGRSRRKASALVVLGSMADAQAAAGEVHGDLSNPLLVTPYLKPAAAAAGAAPRPAPRPSRPLFPGAAPAAAAAAPAAPPGAAAPGAFSSFPGMPPARGGGAAGGGFSSFPGMPPAAARPAPAPPAGVHVGTAFEDAVLGKLRAAAGRGGQSDSDSSSGRPCHRHEIMWLFTGVTNAGLQILLSIAAGWLTARLRLCDAEVLSRQLNAFAMRAAFPAFIVHLLGIKTDLQDLRAWRALGVYVLWVVLAQAACLALHLARGRRSSPRALGQHVLFLTTNNTGCVGWPVLVATVGRQGAALSMLLGVLFFVQLLPAAIACFELAEWDDGHERAVPSAAAAAAGAPDAAPAPRPAALPVTGVGRPAPPAAPVASLRYCYWSASELDEDARRAPAGPAGAGAAAAAAAAQQRQRYPAYLEVHVEGPRAAGGGPTLARAKDSADSLCLSTPFAAAAASDGAAGAAAGTATPRAQPPPATTPRQQQGGRPLSGLTRRLSRSLSTKAGAVAAAMPLSPARSAALRKQQARDALSGAVVPLLARDGAGRGAPAASAGAAAGATSPAPAAQQPEGKPEGKPAEPLQRRRSLGGGGAPAWAAADSAVELHRMAGARDDAHEAQLAAHLAADDAAAASVGGGPPLPTGASADGSSSLFGARPDSGRINSRTGLLLGRPAAGAPASRLQLSCAAGAAAAAAPARGAAPPPARPRWRCFAAFASFAAAHPLLVRTVVSQASSFHLWLNFGAIALSVSGARRFLDADSPSSLPALAWVDGVLAWFSSACIPVLLFANGAWMHNKRVFSPSSQLQVALLLALKLVALPALMIGLTQAAGLRDEYGLSLVLLTACPLAPLAFLVCQQHGVGAELATSLTIQGVALLLPVLMALIKISASAGLYDGPMLRAGGAPGAQRLSQRLARPVAALAAAPRGAAAAPGAGAGAGSSSRDSGAGSRKKKPGGKPARPGKAPPASRSKGGPPAGAAGSGARGGSGGGAGSGSGGSSSGNDAPPPTSKPQAKQKRPGGASGGPVAKKAKTSKGPRAAGDAGGPGASMAGMQVSDGGGGEGGGGGGGGAGGSRAAGPGTRGRGRGRGGRGRGSGGRGRGDSSSACQARSRSGSSERGGSPAAGAAEVPSSSSGGGSGGSPSQVQPRASGSGSSRGRGASSSRGRGASSSRGRGASSSRGRGASSSRGRGASSSSRARGASSSSSSSRAGASTGGSPPARADVSDDSGNHSSALPPPPGSGGGGGGGKASARGGGRHLAGAPARPRPLDDIRSRDYRELARLVRSHGERAVMRDLCALMSRLKCVDAPPAKKAALLDVLWRILAPRLGTAKPRHCVEAMLTAARLRHNPRGGAPRPLEQQLQRPQRPAALQGQAHPERPPQRPADLFGACLDQFVCGLDAGAMAPGEAPRLLANALYAVSTSDAEVHRSARALVERRLLPAFVASAGDAAAQSMSNALYAAALMRARSLDASDLLARARPGLWERASPQEISNTIWGAATLGQSLSGDQLAPLLDALLAQLPDAKAQHITNVLWAVAVMRRPLPPPTLARLVLAVERLSPGPRALSGLLWAVAKQGVVLPQGQASRLVAAIASDPALPASSAQCISSTLWALATMRLVASRRHVTALLAALEARLPHADANPQALANSLWAVATLRGAGGARLAVPAARLEALFKGLASKLPEANPQALANSLWAAGSLVPPYLPRPLLSGAALQHVVRVMVPRLKQQEVSNIAFACGMLGWSDAALLDPLIDRAAELACGATRDACGAASAGDIQGLCNVVWVGAVLDMRHKAEQLEAIAACAGARWEQSTAEQDKVQLFQLHLWLLDTSCGSRPGAGLAGALAEWQLEECRSAWLRLAVGSVSTSQLQGSVFRALRQLPGVADVALEAATPDGLLRVDVAATAADGTRLAVEVDGPWHFRRPDNGLGGSTLYRDRALTARGYVVVSLPWWEWRHGANGAAKAAYLQAKIDAALARQRPNDGGGKGGGGQAGGGEAGGDDAGGGEAGGGEADSGGEREGAGAAATGAPAQAQRRPVPSGGDSGAMDLLRREQLGARSRALLPALEAGLVQRLVATRELAVPGNCGALAWADDGSLLAAAGDDCAVRLSRADRHDAGWASLYDPGHTDPITSMAFLPGSGGGTLVTGGPAKDVRGRAAAARQSPQRRGRPAARPAAEPRPPPLVPPLAPPQIRVTDLARQRVRAYAGHASTIRALLPLSPAVFASGGDDGTIRCFDARGRGDAGTQSLLVDQRYEAGTSTLGGRASVLALAQDPLAAQYIAAGGGDALVRVYDVRMLRPPPGASPLTGYSRAAPPPWAYALAPAHLRAGGPRLSRQQACSVAWDRGGGRLLASYSGSAYAFDVRKHGLSFDQVLEAQQHGAAPLQREWWRIGGAPPLFGGAPPRPPGAGGSGRRGARGRRAVNGGVWPGEGGAAAAAGRAPGAALGAAAAAGGERRSVRALRSRAPAPGAAAGAEAQDVGQQLPPSLAERLRQRRLQRERQRGAGAAGSSSGAEAAGSDSPGGDGASDGASDGGSDSDGMAGGEGVYIAAEVHFMGPDGTVLHSTRVPLPGAADMATALLGGLGGAAAAAAAAAARRAASSSGGGASRGRGAAAAAAAAAGATATRSRRRLARRRRPSASAAPPAAAARAARAVGGPRAHQVLAQQQQQQQQEQQQQQQQQEEAADSDDEPVAKRTRRSQDAALFAADAGQAGAAAPPGAAAPGGAGRAPRARQAAARYAPYAPGLARGFMDRAPAASRDAGGARGGAGGRAPPPPGGGAGGRAPLPAAQPAEAGASGMTMTGGAIAPGVQMFRMRLELPMTGGHGPALAQAAAAAAAAMAAAGFAPPAAPRGPAGAGEGQAAGQAAGEAAGGGGSPFRVLRPAARPPPSPQAALAAQQLAALAPPQLLPGAAAAAASALSLREHLMQRLQQQQEGAGAAAMLRGELELPALGRQDVEGHLRRRRQQGQAEEQSAARQACQRQEHQAGGAPVKQEPGAAQQEEQHHQHQAPVPAAVKPEHAGAAQEAAQQQGGRPRRSKRRRGSAEPQQAAPTGSDAVFLAALSAPEPEQARRARRPAGRVAAARAAGAGGGGGGEPSDGSSSDGMPGLVSDPGASDSEADSAGAGRPRGGGGVGGGGGGGWGPFDGSDGEEEEAGAGAHEDEELARGYSRAFTGHRSVVASRNAAWLGSRSEWVVSGSDDGRLWVWHAGSGEVVAVLRGGDRAVKRVAVHPSRMLLASCGSEPLVRLWSPEAAAAPDAAATAAAAQRGAPDDDDELAGMGGAAMGGLLGLLSQVGERLVWGLLGGRGGRGGPGASAAAGGGGAGAGAGAAAGGGGRARRGAAAPAGGSARAGRSGTAGAGAADGGAPAPAPRGGAQQRQPLSRRGSGAAAAAAATGGGGGGGAGAAAAPPPARAGRSTRSRSAPAQPRRGAQAQRQPSEERQAQAQAPAAPEAAQGGGDLGNLVAGLMEGLLAGMGVQGGGGGLAGLGGLGGLGGGEGMMMAGGMMLPLPGGGLIFPGPPVPPPRGGGGAADEEQQQDEEEE
ncbi:hypothetical protein HT031_003189 [Scenedesmus sp. PABB004]|nr:hypothetical protein HT031_003189 [Scenedesmus sp. PABB004]